jgi:hypothetical protein
VLLEYIAFKEKDNKKVLRCFPSIVSWSSAALLHKKPASTGTSHDSCGATGNNKEICMKKYEEESLYNIP